MCPVEDKSASHRTVSPEAAAIVLRKYMSAWMCVHSDICRHVVRTPTLRRVEQLVP
jgi:hypothetical protein